MEWRYDLYSVYMFKRQKSHKGYVPSDDERNAIIEAYKLSNNQFYPRIQLGYVTCLAETVKCLRDTKTILHFGDKTFSNALAAVNFIRENAE